VGPSFRHGAVAIEIGERIALLGNKGVDSEDLVVPVASVGNGSEVEGGLFMQPSLDAGRLLVRQGSPDIRLGSGGGGRGSAGIGG
jgi:hypothetical protein